MPTFNAIIFDLGRTLIYFDGHWKQVEDQADQALADELEELGFEIEKNDFLSRFRDRVEQYYQAREEDYLEHTTQVVLKDILAECGYPNVSQQVLRDALAAFYNVSQNHWKTEHDAHATLDILRARGFRMGMISNAADDADVQALVDQAQLRPYFDKILTSACVGLRKPDERIFNKLLDHWRLPASRVVMVGDMLNADILGARNAGIFSVWIKRRVNPETSRRDLQYIQPDAVIDTLSELPNLLNELSEDGK
jgi:HAD superfamily hydrolase (TIGR01549 family)